MSLITSKTPFDLDLRLKDTHVLVTGGCGMIGKVVVHAFLAAGCNVSILDITEECPFDQHDERILYQRADITQATQVAAAFSEAERRFGTVATCIALASLDLSFLEQCDSLADMDPKTWQRVFDVNINGTFMTCQRWLQSVREAASDQERARSLRNVNLVIMGSESGRFGVRTMAAYAAGKSAVQYVDSKALPSRDLHIFVPAVAAHISNVDLRSEMVKLTMESFSRYGLLQSLAQDVPRIFPRARVNAVAPGTVNTELYRQQTAENDREWFWRDNEAT